jgi:hypothetical protein
MFFSIKLKAYEKDTNYCDYAAWLSNIEGRCIVREIQAWI